MLPLAKQLSAWIEQAGDTWPFGDGVVLWARPFGTDFERAWTVCPRADYQVALAAIGACEHDLIYRVACDATRALIPLCPEHAKVLTAMQDASESVLQNRPLPPRIDVGQKEAAVALREAALAAHAEEVAARPAIESFLAARVSEVRAKGGSNDDVVASVERALGEAPELAILRTIHDARLERLCLGDVLRAALVSLVMGRLVESMRLDSALLLQHEDDDDEERLVELAPVMERFEDNDRKLFAAAAEVFWHSGLAQAYGRARGDATWKRCIATLARARVGGDETAASEALANLVDDQVAKDAEKELAANAAALREAVAFEALDFSGDEDDDDDDARPLASLEEARALLRRGLGGALEAVRVLGDTSLAEAIETAFAVLNAPGPLDRSSLAPILETVHERLAKLFRAEGHAAGREGEKWLHLADRVEADKHMFSEWLGQHGTSQAN